MKNAFVLVHAEEIKDHVGELWKTREFQQSHLKGGLIHDVVEAFASVPRIFADMSNDRLERAHFSTWWNVMMNRDYDNPVIHDLYWLHEIYHAGHMPYVPQIGKKAFDEKMQRNELEASSLSEITVYFEFPELRDHSFSHEIYADRFLDDPFMQLLWKTNRPAAIETIRTIRRDVMLSKPEHAMDETEKWIRRFTVQNDVYAATWADSYLDVESHMVNFQRQACVNRTMAAEQHFDWVERLAAEDPVDNIPFRTEAELFSAFYWANKAKYDAAMKEA